MSVPLVARRVKKGAIDTLTAYFYDGGESPVDKGAVSVSVASDDGTVLQTGAATNTSGTYTFALSLAATAAIDLLTVTWTSGTETLTTYVEVVGGFYFELAELRAMNDLGSDTAYPTARLRAARDWIEGRIDQACNASFVRRYARDRWASWAGDTRLVLRDSAWPRRLLSVTVAGTAQDVSTLAVTPYGEVTYSTGLPWLVYGWQAVDVRYEAAYVDVCPPDLHDAALQAARWRLISTDGQSGIPSRATSLTNEFGNVQLATARTGDRPTGIPDVDAVIVDWARRTKVPGLA